MPSTNTLPLLGAAVGSLAVAGAFHAPAASVLNRPTFNSPVSISAAAALARATTSLSGDFENGRRPFLRPHPWSDKHGSPSRVVHGGAPGFGRLRGGNAAALHMTATEATRVKGAPKIEERLANLRSALMGEKLDALLVLSGDAHHSEYPSERDRCMRYISGFTGSAGTVMITAEGEQFLVTDGRYTIQAGQELDLHSWKVMQVGARMPSMPEHLKSALGATQKKIGVDAATISLETWRDLEKSIAPHILVALDTSPLNTQWEADTAAPRPLLPQAPAAEHAIEYAGVSASDKLAKLRADLHKEKANAMVVSALDEVAWLLNIRGSDIAYCPLVMSHVVVTDSAAILFIDDAKLDASLRSHIAAAGYTTKPYHDFIPTLTSLASSPGLQVWVDPGTTSWAVFSALGFAGGDKPASKQPAVEKLSPMAMPKAVKNDAEMRGLEAAHVRDGVAMARFFSWLEHEVADGTVLDEIDASDEAERQRRRVGGDMFRGLSFPTIAASGPHGAITHYFPSHESKRPLARDEMFLCDSGAQYADGTTDVTRTMFFGSPPAEMVRDFTLVLKGHINLASCVFPKGTLGGIDYGHGTGHGVGAYLNVHEGPHSISFRRRENEPALEKGMTTSIEPGYYQEGSHGIRLENICLVKAFAEPHKMGTGVELLTFEPLTLIPFQRKLIDASLLTHEEKKYLDDYHARVWSTVSPLLQEAEDAKALDWLRVNTAPLSD